MILNFFPKINYRGDRFSKFNLRLSYCCVASLQIESSYSWENLFKTRTLRFFLEKNANNLIKFTHGSVREIFYSTVEVRCFSQRSCHIFRRRLVKVRQILFPREFAQTILMFVRFAQQTLRNIWKTRRKYFQLVLNHCC